MIRNEWKAPNFAWVGTDADGQRYEQIGYAETREMLEQKLADRNIDIEDIQAFDFSAWQKKATDARDAIIEQQKAINDGTRKQPLKFKNKLWQVLKWHLFELFFGKCAYCESEVRHVASGDVEHYRPKRKVTDVEGHPGYYWLAYEVANLLPCCELCNRARAKQNWFPLEPEDHRVDSPDGDLDVERPLLLHPYVIENPREHLHFDATTGKVAGRTTEGRESVTRYHLNRPELTTKRREISRGIWKHLWTKMAASDFNDPAKAAEEASGLLRRRYAAGEAAYSAAIIDEISRLEREGLPGWGGGAEAGG